MLFHSASQGKRLGILLPLILQDLQLVQCLAALRRQLLHLVDQSFTLDDGLLVLRLQRLQQWLQCMLEGCIELLLLFALKWAKALPCLFHALAKRAHGTPIGRTRCTR